MPSPGGGQHQAQRVAPGVVQGRRQGMAQGDIRRASVGKHPLNMQRQLTPLHGDKHLLGGRVSGCPTSPSRRGSAPPRPETLSGVARQQTRLTTGPEPIEHHAMQPAGEGRGGRHLVALAVSVALSAGVSSTEPCSMAVTALVCAPKLGRLMAC